MVHQGLARQIREFWFADTLEDPARIEARLDFWFAPDPARDSDIRQRWQSVTEDAMAGRLDSMGEVAGGRLALILLLDQFPRNIFRGLPRAFEMDGRARYLMRDGMSQLMDLELAPIERCFYYMPLQHSEFLEDQESGVSRYTHLVGEVSLEQRRVFDRFRNFAQKHCDVIARFGRFPHRNSILSRLNTAEEDAFLAGRSPDFGQP